MTVAKCANNPPDRFSADWMVKLRHKICAFAASLPHHLACMVRENRGAHYEHLRWPELMSKTVDDLSHIVRDEIRLEISLQRLIESQTEKIAGMLFLLIASAYGCLCLLGGIVLLLHLWLPLWLAFLITGAAFVASGFLLQQGMSAAARAKSP